MLLIQNSEVVRNAVTSKLCLLPIQGQFT